MIMGDYDKVYNIPQYSEIEQGDINLGSKIFDMTLELPIISAPMDTVSKLAMLKIMKLYGCLGIHHRYCDYGILKNAIKYGGIAVAPSMDLAELEGLLDLNYYKIARLDVAHGHTKRNLAFCKDLKIMGWDVIGGNICTVKAAEDYLSNGINHIPVGIGSGSVCLTRQVTGVGKPNYLAIPEIKHEFGDDIKIIADGGLANTGDIAKVLTLGADYVMLGRMLASTYEAENDGIYSGMASSAALRRNGKTEFFIEGKSEVIDVNMSVSTLIAQIRKALETTCYYTGARTLKELTGKYEIEK
jgi:IMP dehydrogenase